MLPRARKFFTAVVVVGAAIGTGCSSSSTPVDAAIDEGVATDASVDAPLVADAGPTDAASSDLDMPADAGDVDEGIILII